MKAREPTSATRRSRALVFERGDEEKTTPGCLGIDVDASPA